MRRTDKLQISKGSTCLLGKKSQSEECKRTRNEVKQICTSVHGGCKPLSHKGNPSLGLKG